MKRRDLFKGLAAMFAAIPLARLLPAVKATNRPQLTFNRLPQMVKIGRNEVDFDWYNQTELTLTIDEFSKKYITPAMQARMADSPYEHGNG